MTAAIQSLKKDASLKNVRSKNTPVMASAKSRGDDDPYLASRHLLVFKRREREGDHAMLMRCSTAAWRSLTTILGNEISVKIEPLGYAIRPNGLAILISGCGNSLREWHAQEASDMLRPARQSYVDSIAQDLPQDVLEAIHLAIFPEGPAAIAAILEALDKLDSTQKSNVIGSASTNQNTQAITAENESNGQWMQLAFLVPTRKTSDSNKARYAAIRRFAELISDQCWSKGLITKPKILGVEIRHHTAMVGFSCPKSQASSLMNSSARANIAHLKLSLIDEGDTISLQKTFLDHAKNHFEERWKPSPIALATPAPKAEILTDIPSSIIFPWPLRIIQRVFSICRRRPAISSVSISNECQNAWSFLLAQSGRNSTKIQTVQAKCLRFAQLARNAGSDVEAANLLATIEHLVPALAADLEKIANHGNLDTRRDAVIKITSTLEKLGDAADAAHASLLQPTLDSLFTTLSYIDLKTQNSPFAALPNKNH